MILRGDIYYADLSPVIGSEQGGMRPVLIIQNDIGNRYSPTVIAAAMTSRTYKKINPAEMLLQADDSGLRKDSVVLLNQIKTLDKKRLHDKVGHLNIEIMTEINKVIAISLGL